MGTPLQPNEPGNDCINCFGVGKTFGDVVTPTIVQVRLTSLLPGEFYTEPAEQLPWTLSGPPPRTILFVMEIAPARPAFDQQFAPLCALDIESGLSWPAGTIMYGGFANITWDLEGL